MLAPILQEMLQEAATTRRVLERVPEDKLAWQPHLKSMTLGQLAMHVASIPGVISGMVAGDGFDASQANFMPAQPDSKAQLLKTLEDGLAGAETFLTTTSPSAAVVIR